MTRHGQSRSPEYRIWAAMLTRCNNSNSKSYARYGGRGIRVCDRWRTFEPFIMDMGAKPSANHQIDRIDNSGNYEPSNCRWATTTEQARNTRKNVMLSHDGKSMCIAAWAEFTGIGASTIQQRLKKGASPSEALTRDVNSRHLVLTINGVSKPLRQWSDEYGITTKTLWNRTKAAWPESRLLLPTRRY